MLVIMPTAWKNLGGHIALALSICPSVYLFVFSFVHPFVHHSFVTSHIFGTMYCRILKFHICIGMIALYEKLADLYFFFFFFCQILHGGVTPIFRLRHFSN